MCPGCALPRLVWYEASLCFKAQPKSPLLEAFLSSFRSEHLLSLQFYSILCASVLQLLFHSALLCSCLLACFPYTVGNFVRAENGSCLLCRINTCNRVWSVAGAQQMFDWCYVLCFVCICNRLPFGQQTILVFINYQHQCLKGMQLSSPRLNRDWVMKVKCGLCMTGKSAE